jgi:hypothetical protein
MTASGQIQLACVNNEYIYISTDYGSHWSACYSTTKPWTSIAISSFGQYITAVESGGYIYTCVNNLSSGGVVTVGNYSSTSGVTGVAGSMYYDTTVTAGATALMISSGSGWTSVKSFVIDHPIDKNKYLVHGCLEGPEAGVYYRGKNEITDHQSVTIYLPEYVEKMCTNMTIQVTPIYNGTTIINYNASEVVDNKFTVYGPNGKFYWIVYGTRLEFEVEPLKENTSVKGDGPYKWINSE